MDLNVLICVLLFIYIVILIIVLCIHSHLPVSVLEFYAVLLGYLSLSRPIEKGKNSGDAVAGRAEHRRGLR